jgi:hypothetical protein
MFMDPILRMRQWPAIAVLAAMTALARIWLITHLKLILSLQLGDGLLI